MKRMIAYFALALGLSGPAASQGVEHIEFLKGWRAANGDHIAAVRMVLGEGWKTYWRAPQGAGIPPVLSVTQHTNLKDVEILFPKPKVYEEFGDHVLGYKGEVTFPIRFSLLNGASPANVQSELAFGVCKDVCVPMRFNMAALLEKGNSDGVSVIKSAIAAGAANAKKHRVGHQGCEMAADGKATTLTTRFDWPSDDMPRFAVVEYPNDAYWVAPTKLDLSNGALTVQTQIKYYGTGANILQRDNIRVSLLTDDHIFEFKGC